MISRWQARALFPCVAFVLILTGCSSDAPTYEPLPSGAVVLAFGDSVTHGTGAKSHQSYPVRLAERSGWRVINAGIPGDTAREAGHRLGALLQEHQPQLVIVELGGNDFLRKRRAKSVKQDLSAIVGESLVTSQFPQNNAPMVQAAVKRRYG